MWVPVFGDSRCGLFPGGSGAFGVGGGMVLDGSGWFCRLFDVGDTPFNFLFLKLQLTSGCRRWMFLQENACQEVAVPSIIEQDACVRQCVNSVGRPIRIGMMLYNILQHHADYAQHCSTV